VDEEGEKETSCENGVVDDRKRTLCMEVARKEQKGHQDSILRPRTLWSKDEERKSSKKGGVYSVERMIGGSEQEKKKFLEGEASPNKRAGF